MTNGIDLLESISQATSLRHASSADLATVFNERDASNALKQAVLSGSTTSLAQEFGASDANDAINIFTPAGEDEGQIDDDVLADSE